MAIIARHGDACSTPWLLPPPLAPACSTSTTCDNEGKNPNVKAGGIPIHLLTHNTAIHLMINPAGPPTCIPHQAPLVTSSLSVRVGGLGIARVGDSYGLGEKIVAGFPTVNVGN